MRDVEEANGHALLPVIIAVSLLDGVQIPPERSMDAHVGTRVRLRRTLLGLSQKKLGKALGLTFQQVQKYETGKNRISASRLFHVARMLGVPIAFFFDGLPDSRQGKLAGLRSHLAGSAEPQEKVGDENLHQREALKLVRAYSRLSDSDVRKRVLDLIKALAPEE